VRRALKAREYLHFKQIVRWSRSSAAMIHTVGHVTSLPQWPVRSTRASSTFHLESSALAPFIPTTINTACVAGAIYAAVVDVAAPDWTHNETFILASYAASFAGAYRLCLSKLSICIQISIKQQWTPAITSARSMAYLPSLIHICILARPKCWQTSLSVNPKYPRSVPKTCEDYKQARQVDGLTCSYL
jgi:hypothetical protein